MHEFTPQESRSGGSRECPVGNVEIDVCRPQYPLRAAYMCSAAKVRLDQFYTKPEIAADLYGTFKGFYDPTGFLMIEPSAGAGAFFRLLPPGSLGFDLVPASSGILKADFLKEDLGTYVCNGRKLAVIGNPPFGQAAAGAIDFFNHAARWADVIAFIMPRSIRKFSLENKLDRHFHLVHEEDVPPDAFLHNGTPRHVPTVFQIWERRATLRSARPDITKHSHFEFTRRRDEADFAIRRIGANAGRVCDKAGVTAGSHYFIKGPVRAIMEQIDFSAIAANVTGPRSISQAEIVFLYCEYLSATPRPKR